jgi:hypothetical protein
MAVDPDPVDRAVETTLVPLVGLREAPGELGELNLDQVDYVPKPDQLLADLSAIELNWLSRAVSLDSSQKLGRSFPLPLGHGPSLQTNVRCVKTN